MNGLKFAWIAGWLSLFLPLGAVAQNRTVAVTVDDLPYAKVGALSPSDVSVADDINQTLLLAFKRHHTPVTGFVIQQSAEALGVAAGTRILKRWTTGDFDLGN